jgi:hypothetical protein
MKCSSEAKEWVHERVKDHVLGDILFVSYMTFARRLVDNSGLCRLSKTEDGKFHYAMSDEIAKVLRVVAREDSAFFDECSAICNTNVQAGAEVPGDLKNFASDIFNQLVCRPTPNHRPRTSNWSLDYVLLTLAREVRERFGMALTRNDASPPHSACDAVAAGLKLSGCNIRYSEIKDLIVHPSKKRTRDEIDAYFRISSRWESGLLIPSGVIPAEEMLEAEASLVLSEIRRTYGVASRPSPSFFGNGVAEG